MNKLITVVGPSGVGKTTFVRALAKTGVFQTAYEEHEERPFQALFKEDARYALANQIDYLLRCAEQEEEMRASPRFGLMDGGLDLDFHGFTRLFHSRGLLSDPELDLCQHVYRFIRSFLPQPELIVRLCADQAAVSTRLAARNRINIASPADTALFDFFIDQWLATVPADQVFVLDVSNETLDYARSVRMILDRIGD